MALSRIGCSKDLSTVLSRITHTTSISQAEAHYIRKGLEAVKSAIADGKASLHVSGVRRYPDAPKIPLPSNVSEIFGNETGRFTPERSRDIAAPVLAYVTGQASRDPGIRKAYDANYGNWGVGRSSSSDIHVESYDCIGAVSLNSSMQSNVPIPFCSSGKASHFNMPGGQWAKDCKYIAEDMQNSHYKSVKAREIEQKRRTNGPVTNAVLANLTPGLNSRHVICVSYSTDSSATAKETENKAAPITAAVRLTSAEKLKKAVKDYGSTVIVFHVGISLISLGACYLAVSSGVDVGAFVKFISSSGSERFENAVANSSTFLIAYAVHKLLAPIRISVTLATTPFLVQYLRRVGILKMPKT